MVRAIIFDVFETLITHYTTPLYFGAEMAKDIGITTEEFQKYWKSTFSQRSIGEMSFEEILETILKVYDTYSDALFHSILKKRIETKNNAWNILIHEFFLCWN
ncbi:MAG: HAD family hydrolase, partial [Firmicutes bacterium]|nr:HAD family hydrolase [Bacillota bacterium]